MRGFSFKYLLVLTLILLGLAACAPATPTPPTFTPPADTPTYTNTATHTPSPTFTFTPSPTFTFTPTFTHTATFTPTATATETPVPTYVELRGKVTIERMVCHFGPGAPYLYKYSVFQDTVLEIIGRMERGSYILVQAVGGNNPCWVNSEYMEIRGDINTVKPVDPHVVLAWSPYYDALTGVSAEREGDIVTVFWNPLILRAGDDSEQTPYIVEAWVCIDGEITFTPIGSYSTAAEVRDEAGCVEDSYARVFAAEKHGYTQWRVIDWPQHPEN